MRLTVEIAQQALQTMASAAKKQRVARVALDDMQRVAYDLDSPTSLAEEVAEALPDAAEPEAPVAVRGSVAAELSAARASARDVRLDAPEGACIDVAHYIGTVAQSSAESSAQSAEVHTQVQLATHFVTQVAGLVQSCIFSRHGSKLQGSCKVASSPAMEVISSPAVEVTFSPAMGVIFASSHVSDFCI